MARQLIRFSCVCSRGWVNSGYELPLFGHWGLNNGYELPVFVHVGFNIGYELPVFFHGRGSTMDMNNMCLQMGAKQWV